MLWVPVVGAILLWVSPPACTARTVLQGHSYKISPKPCSVNGLDGTCMFVWECIKTEGRHVGMCVDTFMFGSCCAHSLTDNAILAPAEGSGGRPDILYSSPSHTVATTPRPSGSALFMSVATRPNFTTRPSNSSSPTRPSNLTLRPQTSSTFLTSITNTRPDFTTSSNATSFWPPSETRPHFTTRPEGSDPMFILRPSAFTNTKPTLTARPPLGHFSSPAEGGETSSPSVIQLESSGGKEPSRDSTLRPPGIVASDWESPPPAADGASTMESASSAIMSSWASAHTTPGAIWQATTEPGFVTRPRPPAITSSSRPRPTRRPVAPTSKTTPPTTATKTTTTAGTTTSAPTTTTSTTTTTVAATSTTTTTTTTTTTSPLPPTTTLVSATAIQSLPATSGDKGVQCGVPPLFPRPETRIVGGRNAPFGGWPWQVSVRRTSFFGFSSTHRCGGAVLNENWIATAGHCVDDLLTSQIRIRVGEYDFSSVQEPYPFVERGVGRKVVHPKYNFFTYEYDLALVRLDSPLSFAPHIAPICLPASDDLLIGENATVTGWGRLSEGGTLPSILQEVSVPIVSNDCCKSMFLRAGRHEFIPEIFLCAGHENGGQDSCQGDSGGPLQVRGKDGRYFLAGIISWGIGCAEANLPGVCTRISKFVPWILENVS